MRKWWKVKALFLQYCALHTVPLKSKLPVASHFLCDKYRVAQESLKRQFLAQIIDDTSSEREAN